MTFLGALVLFFCYCLIVFRYFATLEYDVDEGVGPERFEDPEDFVEPGKQPFDHDEPF